MAARDLDRMDASTAAQLPTSALAGIAAQAG
jgi:hypothetical protein